jgi:hypothetical protein
MIFFKSANKKAAIVVTPNTVGKTTNYENQSGTS